MVSSHVLTCLLRSHTYPFQELTHFCWRPRNQTADWPELDLIMLPGDARFVPFVAKGAAVTGNNVTSPANGRIFVLKFSSSSQRHLFWLQSISQHPETKNNWFSQRDLRVGQLVDQILQGEEVDLDSELANIRSANDDDHDMDDAPSRRLRANSTGGAGADATGGDIRDEGEEAREGGEDGARA